MEGTGIYFTELLIDWFSKAKRELPWRKTKDPYKIWLSEIILQQTRVEQGLPYYLRFVEEHPDVHSLANSSEQDVLKLWEGLGYYSRARNLHAAAKYVSQELGGVFPPSYAGLLKLKGVGPYTAAAIASIAFKEAVPVVDGNVFRFASRVFGIKDDIAAPATRKIFESTLSAIISQKRPDDFNQAMMEHGATVCTPNPKCEECVFREECYAYKNDEIENLPVKSKKVKVLEEHFCYLILRHDDLYLLHSRANGIWKGLYQFYQVADKDLAKALEHIDGTILHQSAPVKHILTHRKLWVKFIEIETGNKKTFRELGKELGMDSYSYEEMLNLPRPKVIVNYLQQKVI